MTIAGVVEGLIEDVPSIVVAGIELATVKELTSKVAGDVEPIIGAVSEDGTVPSEVLPVMAGLVDSTAAELLAIASGVDEARAQS
jgi:hypothetical protein